MSGHSTPPAGPPVCSDNFFSLTPGSAGVPLLYTSPAPPLSLQLVTPPPLASTDLLSRALCSHPCSRFTPRIFTPPGVTPPKSRVLSVRWSWRPSRAGLSLWALHPQCRGAPQGARVAGLGGGGRRHLLVPPPFAELPLRGGAPQGARVAGRGGGGRRRPVVPRHWLSFLSSAVPKVHVLSATAVDVISGRWSFP